MALFVKAIFSFQQWADVPRRIRTDLQVILMRLTVLHVAPEQ
jgi:hypothetical protein